MKYLFELFESVPRQGPGSNKFTKKAYDMVKGYLPEHPKILDVGSGKGTATFKLAEISNGSITAIDIHQPYVDFINKKAEEEYIDEIVKAETGDMTDLKLPAGRFDVVWCEGAVYNLGFEKGLTELMKLVKTMGFIVVSEPVYLTDSPPGELKSFWDKTYAGIDSIENKLGVIEKLGMKVISHFTLPEEGWTVFYYEPLKKAMDELSEKNKDEEAQQFYKEMQNEMDVFNAHKAHYSYQYFVLKKV